MKCLVCDVEFVDLGNHPLTCGKKECAKEAYARGWWDLSSKKAQELRFDVTTKPILSKPRR